MPTTTRSAAGAADGVRPRTNAAKLMTVNDICENLACSRRWLERARASGAFPPADVVLGRHPRWRQTTFEGWLSGQRKGRR